YAQLISMLPISLFGASVSAAELPAMSSELGADDEVARKLRERLDGALRRVAFLVIPSAVAFVGLGDFLVGAIYQGGKFMAADTLWVWGILAGSSAGLLASVFGRLYASAFYALRDTQTPMRIAILRVVLSIVLGAGLALFGPQLFGVDVRWGVAGLTLGSGLGGWIEYGLLRAALRRRIGPVGTPRPFLATLWGLAIVSAVAGGVLRFASGTVPALVVSLAGLLVYAVTYVALARVAGVREVAAVLARLPGRRAR
ncbi:MAG: murein biosynthesis integral membrane protein MurJ, partial [Gemmatimonadetes bacterium]|nr:murein biosynthesis integral membrane protein MurJ [Gemmatimonadota bacterium]